MPDESEPELHHDVACMACGCVCDDLTVAVRNGQVQPIDLNCNIGEEWFAKSNVTGVALARLQGETVSVEAAIDRAVEILRESSNPLIYGLSGTTTNAQREAVALADTIGACIDTTASVCHAPSIMAIQSVGESTSTLGEVATRSDLVIYWGADPQKSHPRHLERYSAEPTGIGIPNGRADRELVVIDVAHTETASIADRFIQVDRGSDFEMITRLRQLLQDDPPETTPAFEDDPVIWLAERMRNCRYGVVFFGLGLAQQGLGHLTVEVLLKLVAETNRHARFVARRLRIPGDVTGADSVLCWQTGYPFAVSLGRDFPRYNPGEFTANDLLERGEVDSAVLIGTESLKEFSPAALRSLFSIPTIVLDDPGITMLSGCDVEFRTSVAGVHEAGCVYRMDEVPIPVRKLNASGYPSDTEILRAIGDQLKSG